MGGSVLHHLRDRFAFSGRFVFRSEGMVGSDGVTEVFWQWRFVRFAMPVFLSSARESRNFAAVADTAIGVLWEVCEGVVIGFVEAGLTSRYLAADFRHDRGLDFPWWCN